MVNWLTRISETYQVPVTSPISFYRWLGQRQLRMAVSARTPISARSRPYVDEVRTIAAQAVNFAVNKHMEEQQ
jgi:chromosome partitioning protein